MPIRRLAGAAAAVALGVLAAPGLAAGPRIALRVTVWPDGKDGSSTTWTLRCSPVGGTLPQRARACAALSGARAPFRPVPPDVVCTQIYGGPQLALVVGRAGTRRVWTWFRRTDGCQIARWDAVRVLFPVK
jgi:Subtilisin inhibitor-like